MNEEKRLKELMDVMTKTLEILSNIMGDKTDAKLRIMKQCLEEITKDPTGEPCHIIMDRKNAEIIEDYLLKKGVPYIGIEYGNDEKLIMVPNKRAEQLNDILNTIKSSDARYCKQVSYDRLLSEIHKVGYDDGFYMSGFEEGELELFTEKIYECGNTYAIDNKGDVFLSPQTIYSNENGDMCDIKLKMALEKSKESPLMGGGAMFEIRKQQAIYDKNEMAKFLEAAIGQSTEKEDVFGGGGNTSKNIVLADPTGESKCCLTIEGDPAVINYKEKNEKGKWEIKDSIDTTKKGNAFCQEFISRHSDKIYNMACISRLDFVNELQNKDKGEISKEFIAKYNKRPAISEEFKDKYTAYKQFESILEDVMDEVRGVAKNRIGDVNLLHSDEIKNAINIKDDILLEILCDPDKSNTLSNFLSTPIKDADGNVIISPEEKEQWLKDIVKNYNHYDRLENKNLDEMVKRNNREKELTRGKGMEKEPMKEEVILGGD